MVEPATFGSRLSDVIIIMLCALAALCCVIPLWHVVMSSISDPKLLLKHEGLVIWPLGEVNWEGYKKIFQNDGLLMGLFNTLLTGPGKVWLQTMPISNVAASITPYIPTGNG